MVGVWASFLVGELVAVVGVEVEGRIEAVESLTLRRGSQPRLVPDAL
jgi:hypothetical protein